MLAPLGQPRIGDGSERVETVTVGLTFVDRLRDLRPPLAVVCSPPADTEDMLAAAAERRLRPSLRLIFLNEPADVAGRLDALALGFDDALPSTTDPGELAGRARILLDGAGRRGPDEALQVSVTKDVVLDLAAHRVRRRGANVHLRPKEFALLALLATEPGRVFSRDELVARIWGQAYHGGTRTVDVHIRWLRAKVEDDPAQPAHLMTVRGIGYRLDPPDREPRSINGLR